MKTQPQNNARRTTGAVESSRTQAGGAVGRTTARAGQQGGAVPANDSVVAGCEEALGIPLFPDIAQRRDFPLGLSHAGLIWSSICPDPVY